MKGAIGELYGIDLNCSQSNLWTKALKKKEDEGGLVHIGIVNEVRYNQEGGYAEVMYAK